MLITFRTDASLQIGTGHVMRCLTLADALRARGGKCRFVCRAHDGHLLDVIHRRGHDALALPAGAPAYEEQGFLAHDGWLGTDWASDAQATRDALQGENVDWLVLDHYALDHRWERAMRPSCRSLLVIDDLADRRHDCDWLIDQNLGRTAADYDGLLDRNTKLLIGPSFAILRPEFTQWRDNSLQRRAGQPLRNLLITMGGVDQGNATEQLLHHLQSTRLSPNLRITAVMGPHAPWLDQVREQAAAMPWPTQVLTGVDNMAQLMAANDLAIGAAGGTAWERCTLGLPSVVVVLAANQEKGAAALQQLGAAMVINDIGNVGAVLKSISGKASILEDMSKAAAKLIDGKGVVRILETVFYTHV